MCVYAVCSGPDRPALRIASDISDRAVSPPGVFLVRSDQQAAAPVAVRVTSDLRTPVRVATPNLRTRARLTTRPPGSPSASPYAIRRYTTTDDYSLHRVPRTRPASLATPTSRLRASLLELRFPGSLYLFYDIYHRRRVQAFRTSICSPLLVMLETLAHLHGSLEHTPENGGRSSVRCNAGGV